MERAWLDFAALLCDTKHLDPAAIPRVGYMILSETEHLTTALQELRKAKFAG